MREIKFRAWDIEDKSMDSWEEIESVWESFGYTSNVFDHDHYIPMQFTGLIDKSGVDIYEGDIIESDKNCLYDDGKKIEVVKFAKGQYQIGTGTALHIIVESFKPEVIGNIHENPELLEAP